EVLLTARPITLPSFSWESSVSLATNDNELVSFGDNRTEIIVSGQSYGSMQRHREGYPLAGYWFAMPARDAQGNPIPLTATTVQLEDSLTFVGPSAPTREVSFSNTFTFLRDFRAFVLFDYKGGHYLWNYKEFNRCASNQNCARVNDPSLMDHPDRPIWLATNAKCYWIAKADFVKLRDVSLTYTVPQRFLGTLPVTGATLTVAGHNLAQWTDYSGLDPEVNGYGNRAFGRADVYPVPM